MPSHAASHAATALATLLLASCAFLLLENRYFTTRNPSSLVQLVPAPVLAPIVPMPAPHARTVPRFPVFIIYQQNPGMLSHAFQSAHAAFPGQVVIISNSDDSTQLAANPDYATAAAHVFRTVTHLSFPQLHNTMAALAAAWGFGVYGWMHSDAVVLQVQPEAEDLGAVLLGKLEQLGSHWAAAFTSYDVLAFYNTQAVLEMPWDEHLLQNYIADCDAHNRWRLANFTAGPLEGLDPHMHMVHLAAAPSKRWDQLSHRQRWDVYPPLDKTRSDMSPTQWKDRHSSARFLSAQEHRFVAGRAYYADKWNTTECDIVPPHMDARPRFDVHPSPLWSARP